MCVFTNVHELVQTLPKRVARPRQWSTHSIHNLTTGWIVSCYWDAPFWVRLVIISVFGRLSRKTVIMRRRVRGEKTRGSATEKRCSPKWLHTIFPCTNIPPDPHRNPALRCSKRFDHRSHLISFVIVRV